MTAGGRVLKLWHSQRGRLALDAAPPELDARGLSERFEGARVLSLEPGALTALASAWQGQAPARDDVVVQILCLLRLIDSRVADPETGFDLHPQRPVLRGPSFFQNHGLGFLLPPERCLIWLISDRGRYYASLVVRNGLRGVDLVSSCEALITTPRPAVLEPSWVRACAEEARERWGPVHLAVGIERRDYWQLRRCPTGAQRKAMRRRGAWVDLGVPLAWKVLLWGAERAFVKRQKRRGDARARRWAAPLSDTELEACF